MKNTSLRARMLLAFLAIFLLPLLLIGIPGGIFITRGARENATAEVEQMCAEASTMLEARLARMDSYMLQASHDSLIVGIMNMRDNSSLFQRYTAIELDRYANQLKLILITTDSFDDLALCFPQQNFALTQRGTYSLSSLFQHEFSAMGFSMADWLAQLESLGQAHRFLPINALQTFGAHRQGLLYACPMPGEYEPGVQFAALFFISSTSLDQAFARVIRYPGATLSLTGEDGTELYRLSGERSVAPSEALYTWSQALGQSGLTMNITVPLGEVMRAPNAIQGTVLLILALMGVVGGILSTFVARVNYRPLENLFTILFERGTLPEQHPSASSLKTVETTLSALLDKDGLLQRQLEEYHDLLRYAALSRLLDGSLSIDMAALENTFEALAMFLPYRFFSVGVLYQEQPNAVSLVEQRRQPLQLLAYPLEHDGRLVFLFNHATEDGPRQLFAQPAAPLLYVGVSAPCVLLSDAHQAYRQALYAVNYRPVSAQSGAVFYADVYDTKSNYFYPVEAENRLVNLLRAGDAPGARETFDKLLAHNLRDEPAAYVLYRFFDSVSISVLRQCGINQVSWELAQTPLSPSAPVEALSAWMYGLLDTVAERCAARGEKPPDALLQAIIAHIDDNLCDPQLSLASVAERFHVSASHLSRYIKKSAGIGYLDLVNRKRILLAKTMLRKGNMSIKNIASSVGFDSDVTLRRLFKKYEGVAPTQYAWNGDAG